uniref:Pre-rRNA-processing protein RIX1 N-terminal domain-containing protein n=1 Tax=Aegilops tauschii subsp. strangulata TaxID=200361 RepID=A0A453HS85_AEGTS
TCFLGVTFQECSSERFAESYSDWFEKILRNLQQGPSSLQLVTVVSCTSMSDLFARLAKFLNLKKEASSFAGRVVEPLLLLLNENGPVADEAIDLLRTVIKLYPSSVNRHYNKVESTIAAKIMSTEVNVKLSKKFARVLAMLPSVRVSEGTWSLMIQKVLIGINNLLNDAFVGLEEGREIMMLLVPPGNDPPPVLGDQVKLGGNLHVTKKFGVFTVPTISALAHCCCMMLTSYYPVQVTVPGRALIALSRRVLLVDGSLRNKLFPSTTSLHQELICFELPSLHSSFLDLLHATIKGMRSQLLPHAANIVRLVTDYFKIAKLPTTRTKVYSIVQLLLTSMGVGMSLHLLEVIVSNAVGDLDDNCVKEMTLFSTNPSKGTSESLSKSYSKKRKQEPQIQNSHASGLEKAAISPKKMKTSSMPTSSKGMTPETPGDVRMFTPLCVKIAALETLEILLNVGGSLRTDHWRAKVDLLLINIATSACDSGAGYEPSTTKVGETSISHFRLASYKALLASFLSSPHARPLYLAQGTELFRKGKLEIGTTLAEFCSHALLALDVLTHPRALSLEKAGPLVPGLNRSEPEKAIFGTGTFNFSPSEGQRQVIADEDTYDDWLPSIKDNEPTEKSTLVKEVPQIGSHTIAEAVEDVPACNRSDAIMVVATTEKTSEPVTVDNPSSSNAVSNPIYSRPPETQKAAATPFREEKRADHVDSLLQNKSSAAVNLPFRNLATSGEKPSDPGVAALSSYKDVSSTRFIQPIKADLSDTESGDSMPEIQDGDPDSDY